MSRNILWPRVTIPDVYPRDVDPERPSQGAGIVSDTGVPATSTGAPNWLRSPVRSAPVYRRFIIYELPVTVAPIPLLAQIAEAESILVQVTSAAATPVFLGNAGVTPQNGQRINPGQVGVLVEDNRRYEEELVRAVQELTQVTAHVGRYPATPPPAYFNPRVVLNPNDWFLTAAAPRNVTVTLFYPPERV